MGGLCAHLCADVSCKCAMHAKNDRRWAEERGGEGGRECKNGLSDGLITEADLSHGRYKKTQVSLLENFCPLTIFEVAQLLTRSDKKKLNDRRK